MKKALVIILSAIVLLVIYKMQHVKPVDDPKDTPIFQQRLKSSLERFQVDEFPVRQDRMRDRERLSRKPPSSRPPVRTKDLVVAGRCGRVTLTWVEEKKIAKDSIKIKRKAQNEEYSLLKAMIFDKQEEGGGIRYWASDSGLSDGISYKYLISFKDAGGKEILKKPVSINLTCNEKDREIVAQREKMIKEYYRKRGVDVKDYALKRPSTSPRQPIRTKDLVVTGRCGRVTLTWVEEKKIDKERIRIKRRAPNEEYSLLEGKRIYDRQEEGGTRYWASDNGLKDGLKYEYLISCKDAKEKEIVKGPISINLTCNERDREILAQREKALKEYYKKQGINYAPGKTLTYQLSKEIYKIDLGDSPQKGRKDAPVTLVVFTDFECIHCSTWAQTLNNMHRTLHQDIRIVFKNYPIPYHKQAELAAVSALAAGEQGKFWEMHDLLFRNQKALDKEDILGYAKNLALDLSKFQKSLESKELKKMIDQDKAQGKTIGVQNAPTTFINGRRLVGSPPVSYMKGVIEDILKNKKRK